MYHLHKSLQKTLHMITFTSDADRGFLCLRFVQSFTPNTGSICHKKIYRKKDWSPVKDVWTVDTAHQISVKDQSHLDLKWRIMAKFRYRIKVYILMLDTTHNKNDQEQEQNMVLN